MCYQKHIKYTKDLLSRSVHLLNRLQSLTYAINTELQNGERSGNALDLASLCSVSSICDMMTNYVRGRKRKKMIFNAARCRSRRLKRGKFLLKTQAKQCWLIDWDEASSRSIHHSRTRAPTRRGPKPTLTLSHSLWTLQHTAALYTRETVSFKQNYWPQRCIWVNKVSFFMFNSVLCQNVSLFR